MSNLIFYVNRGRRSAEKGCGREEERGQNAQGLQSHDPGVAEQAHGTGVTEAEIDAVGAQRGQLGQQRDGAGTALPHRPDQRDHIRQEKVPLVHVRKEKGDAQGKHRSCGHEFSTAWLVPVEKHPPQDEQADPKGGQDAKGSRKGLFSRPAVGEKGKHTGGVEDQGVIILAGLFEVDAQNVGQGLSQQQGREDGGQVGGEKDQEDERI